MNYWVPDDQDALGRTPLPFSGTGSDAGIWTDSKLKKFWLLTFRGYVVSQTHSVPKATLLGEVVYRTRWLLFRSVDQPR